MDNQQQNIDQTNQSNTGFVADYNQASQGDSFSPQYTDKIDSSAVGSEQAIATPAQTTPTESVPATGGTPTTETAVLPEQDTPSEVPTQSAEINSAEPAPLDTPEPAVSTPEPAVVEPVDVGSSIADIASIDAELGAVDEDPVAMDDTFGSLNPDL